MPNRILREGILTSDRVNKLSTEAEVFYRRLMSVVDDFGRFDGRTSILRAALYPLKLDSVKESHVKTWLAECQEARLVQAYQVDGKPYVHLLDFRQQCRAHASKYPQPPADAQQVSSTCAADAQHMIASAHLDVFGDVDDKPSCGDVGANGQQMIDIEAIYQAYPRKVGKQDALKAIRKVVANGIDADWLLGRVKEFASSPAGQAGTYTPHPATWFNAGRYDDDPAEWKKAGQAPPEPKRKSIQELLDECRGDAS